jgi:hypothetical protein
MLQRGAEEVRTHRDQNRWLTIPTHLTCRLNELVEERLTEGWGLGEQFFKLVDDEQEPLEAGALKRPVDDLGEAALLQHSDQFGKLTKTPCLCHARLQQGQQAGCNRGERRGARCGT